MWPNKLRKNIQNTIEYNLQRTISSTDNYTLGFKVRHKIYGNYKRQKFNIFDIKVEDLVNYKKSDIHQLITKLDAFCKMQC